MKILETRMAPNPRRVRIFLAEKGIEVPFEQVDLMKGDLKTDAFTKLNPLQRVPVLVLDDGTAICEIDGHLPLFRGATTRAGPVRHRPARARPGRDVEAAHGARAAQLGRQAFRHLHPAMATLEVPQVAAWGEANKPRALEMLQLLDEQLGANRFVAGDAYSVADITALVAIDFMKPARVARPDGLANLERWYDEVSSRPSAKA